MTKIYFDYAAASPVDPRVLREMNSALEKKFANTMSLHAFGQEAKVSLAESREKVARLMSADPQEVFFTSSATESNNLVLKGTAFKKKKGHIVISSIEHPCIAESAKWLQARGYKITEIPVGKDGIVNPEDVSKSIKDGTILVSIIHASNEIGSMQPIEKIGKICKKKKVLFHTDAAQTFGKIPLNVKKMNVDFLTASSHKMYGPKGAACLYIRKGVDIEPLLHGGGQERGIRSSTVNVPAIAGFAEACELSGKSMEEERKKNKKLKEKLVKGVLKTERAYLNGSFEKSLPNIANFRFDFIEGESLAINLDLQGIAVSTGSACSSEKLEPSYVLLALGLRPEQAHGSLRISFGRWTTEKEVDYFLKVLPEVIKKLRKISPFHG